ncbi:acyl-CoA dehydrogenase family protein [Rhabdothermincola sediminis]|uniref:acyl-CoA dehydrogenase family protein n=1 Tax=Rhabdothermincola sediminis TaxID=2751370 RepID=UPI001AA04DCA|nr:acyl-CoA dehydrogenase family protein [Rhabdothermincola sediminis]
MDFTFTEEQQAIADLAGRILGDRVTHERLAAMAAANQSLDRETWDELAKANLLGICLPERDGGSGYGILEACLVLEQVGRTVAPLPYLATVVSGAMLIARFGSDDLRARILPGVIDGSVILTAALGDRHEVIARPDGSGWQLGGDAWFVPWAEQARYLLVPARTPAGEVLVCVVEPDGAGVSAEPLLTTSGLPEAHLAFMGVSVGATDLLGGPAGGRQVLDFLVEHTTVGLCALQAGVSEGALRLTASYTSERHQFGSPIATFQAVAHRAADAYIDTQGIRSTMWQAAWQLAATDAGEWPGAADAIDVAKYWAADGGQRVAHAAQHLHGGIGVDIDYPLHRYFRWAKHLELTLGGATTHLRALGARLAAEPA